MWDAVLLLAPVVAYLIGWISYPFNRAKLFRAFMSKSNWMVVQLCHPGGQTAFYVVKGDSPAVTAGKYSFPIKPEAIRYVGSVPFIVFSSEDTNPLNLSAKKLTAEPYRNPEHLTNFLMLIKAFYEAAAERKKKLLDIAIWVILAVSIITLVLSFQTMQAVNTLSVAEAAAGTGGKLVSQIG